MVPLWNCQSSSTGVPERTTEDRTTPTKEFADAPTAVVPAVGEKRGMELQGQGRGGSGGSLERRHVQLPAKLRLAEDDGQGHVITPAGENGINTSLPPRDKLRQLQISTRS
jgi:hypothetical protein